MATDAEAMEALSNIDKELAARGMGAEALGPGELCQQYKKIKSWLLVALPLIERIPVYGQQIGTALRFLMKVADVACPA